MKFRLETVLWSLDIDLFEMAPWHLAFGLFGNCFMKFRLWAVQKLMYGAYPRGLLQISSCCYWVIESLHFAKNIVDYKHIFIHTLFLGFLIDIPQCRIYI